MLAIALIGGLMSVTPACAAGAVEEADRPERILETYLKAAYARDAETAYPLISRADRAVKSLDDYRRESGTFGGVALELTRVLAEQIRFENMELSADGDRLTATFDVVIPDANAEEVRRAALNFDAGAIADLPPSQRDNRIAGLRQMGQEGLIPLLRSRSERWDLVREEGRWRVWLNWAGAVEITLEAASRAGLPWEVVPVQTRILAVPGETVRAAYRARNQSGEKITAKARHIVAPARLADRLEIVSCFCFLEHALAAGETAEFSLVLRVDYDAPNDVHALTVRYEFYPADDFPGEISR
ncbi:MAG: cytochrome c oxidase assembly protein [Proteobacteria bacterium]|nr:cytochrome c oxidase assembly protein [Pseudomonadota bacterium]